MASAPKQISEFPDAGALSATDYILLQQGATGTALSKTMLGPILDTPHTTMTVSGAGSVSGNLTVGNATFVVTAASGNTAVAGTLSVTGVSTLAALSATTIAGTTGSFSSTATATAFIPTSATVPTNGMYLPTTNTLGWAVNTTAEMQMTGTALSPATSDGLALGTTALMWSDAFFASGSVLNFNNGDVTITHSADTLTVAGGTLATSALTATTGVFSSTATATAFIPSSATVPTNGMYLPAANTLGWAINSATEMSLTASALSPAVSDGLALGTTTLMWSDAFFASGSVLNFNNGDVTLTHSAERLIFDGGKLTATYNSTDASGSTQILTVAGDQSVAHTGNYFAAVLTPTYSADSGNTLAGLFGLYTASTNTSTGTVTQAFGLSANAVNGAGGTITSAIGVSGVTVNSSSGTVTSANGGRFTISNTSTGTITTAYGVYSGLTNTNAGGTVTTFYGAFLATPTNSGTIVNRYGVYQQDAASQNVLFGRTLIGGTTDDGVNKLRVSGGVTVDTGNSYKVNNVAVVGATKTGWTAATGTSTRTTFATTTVTTEQLAQRLKALLDDLISHGLIGA